MHICLSLQSPSLKEKDLPNILASPLSEELCPPDSSTAAKQFPPCPSPANTNPDCLYRKSQTATKLLKAAAQLLQENRGANCGGRKTTPGETMAGKCPFLTRNSQKQTRRREVTIKPGCLCHWTLSTHSHSDVGLRALSKGSEGTSQTPTGTEPAAPSPQTPRTCLQVWELLVQTCWTHTGAQCHTKLQD